MPCHYLYLHVHAHVVQASSRLAAVWDLFRAPHMLCLQPLAQSVGEDRLAVVVEGQPVGLVQWTIGPILGSLRCSRVLTGLCAPARKMRAWAKTIILR